MSVPWGAVQAIIRLSEASAKVRLSNEVEKRDIVRAVSIIKSYIEGLTGTEGFDFDTVETGISTPLKQRIALVLESIESVAHAIQKRTAPLEGIIDRCNSLTPEEVLKTISVLLRSKKIYKTKDNEYGVVRQ